jgi:hypothetical protein
MSNVKFKIQVEFSEGNWIDFFPIINWFSLIPVEPWYENRERAMETIDEFRNEFNGIPSMRTVAFVPVVAIEAKTV